MNETRHEHVDPSGGWSGPGATQTERHAGTATAHPTIFHVTHPKAGSQWIHRILLDCAPDRVVSPRIDRTQIFEEPIRPGAIYAALYMTREEFDGLRLPPGSQRLIVIRDLRDTLVSLYFSVKFSHLSTPVIDEGRARLQSLDVEGGLVFLIDEWFGIVADIQASWLDPEEPPIRYEDLLLQDIEILERVLLDEFGLGVPRERFREAVLANRFERLTGGRPRGSEDPAAHERKGVVGDWRNHFTDRVKASFKARYGELLIATGYERDLAW
jgi:Sulfotransferase domain